jgi:hypothetical protein
MRYEQNGLGNVCSEVAKSQNLAKNGTVRTNLLDRKKSPEERVNQVPDSTLQSRVTCHLTHLALPGRWPAIIQRLFDAIMKAGFVLITQWHMTLKNAAQFCYDPNKQQIQRKGMQPSFIHASVPAYAMPLWPKATT